MFTGLENSGVYIIRHIESGNEYIGSSKKINKRYKQHMSALNNQSHQNSYLQNAWTKYGKSAFEFKVLLVCSPEKMRDYEQLAMEKLNPKYNQSKSAYAGIPLGSTISNEHKIKVGKASVRLWSEQEYRAKVTKAIQESMTDGEKIKRSERTKKLWATPEYRANAVAARKGKAFNKGHKCTPEQVENRRKAGRISNMKRNYGTSWTTEYARRYPECIGDLNAL